jgi:cytoskeleton protein RodZ
MKQETFESVMSRANPGDSLRGGREALGLSIAQAAAQLNLSVSRLEQLEAGEFDRLPGHTFARGYVRSYARLLGLDPNRIVLEFDQFTGTDAAGSEVHALGQIDQPVRVAHSLLRLFSLLVLLALAGVGFYWWQERSIALPETLGQAPAHIEVEGADGQLQLHPLTELEDEALVAADLAPQPPEAEAAAAGVAPGPAQASADAATPAAPAQTPTPVPPQADLPSAPAPASPAQPVTEAAPVSPAAPQSAAVVPAPGQGLVEVAFSDTCWVQVTDADGKVLLGGLRRKGETVTVAGKAPLELRLGVARAASVSYNGAPVDIAPFTSNETARVKLGQ